MELPVVNHEDYFAKIGDDHKFPIKKFGSLASYLINKNIISGGMQPNVNACLYSVKNGVKSAQIINGTVAHSVIAELFTDRGIGTKIVL